MTDIEDNAHKIIDNEIDKTDDNNKINEDIILDKYTNIIEKNNLDKENNNLLEENKIVETENKENKLDLNTEENRNKRINDKRIEASINQLKEYVEFVDNNKEILYNIKNDINDLQNKIEQHFESVKPVTKFNNKIVKTITKKNDILRDSKSQSNIRNKNINPKTNTLLKSVDSTKKFNATMSQKNIKSSLDISDKKFQKKPLKKEINLEDNNEDKTTDNKKVKTKSKLSPSKSSNNNRNNKFDSEKVKENKESTLLLNKRIMNKTLDKQKINKDITETNNNNNNEINKLETPATTKKPNVPKYTPVKSHKNSNSKTTENLSDNKNNKTLAKSSLFVSNKKKDNDKEIKEVKKPLITKTTNKDIKNNGTDKKQANKAPLASTKNKEANSLNKTKINNNNSDNKLLNKSQKSDNNTKHQTQENVVNNEDTPAPNDSINNNNIEENKNNTDKLDNAKKEKSSIDILDTKDKDSNVINDNINDLKFENLSNEKDEDNKENENNIDKNNNDNNNDNNPVDITSENDYNHNKLEDNKNSNEETINIEEKNKVEETESKESTNESGTKNDI